MAELINGKAIGYSFQWKIENIRHCWLKQGEAIVSPIFITDALESTKWSMSLYPMGSRDKNYICVNLHREVEWTGPPDIEVNYQIAFLGKDSTILEQRITKDIFQKPKRWGWRQFLPRETVFRTDKEKFLPDDTLTVRCTIWKEETIPSKLMYFYARTILKADRRFFVWRIHQFIAANPSMRYEFKDKLIDFDLVLSEGLDIEKKLALNINSFDESVKYFSFKTSVIDSDGQKENCCALEYFADDLRRGTLLTKSLIIKKLMDNKSKYLPNDILSLSCGILISTQTDIYEFFQSGKTYPKLANQQDKTVNEHSKENEKFVSFSALMSDLKFMYNDAIFSDTELRTSGKSFPAHKNILSSRSPVFKRMFSHDMKEKNSGHVDIADLEENTVHRMLLYIYTDSLADLQIESALKLYFAADKYEILSLKTECSSFMKKNMCPTKACDVLIFADQHQDVDLKCFVQDYILEHDKEVFGSQEWKDLMDTNPKLAAEIMYKKVYLM